MVTCSPESLVVGLTAISRQANQYELAAPASNNITGPILQNSTLSKLHTLDLSDNFFTGKIPSSLGYLRSLEYILSGEFPLSLANMTQLVLLDLSFNNLRPVPRFPTKTFSIAGNPLICPTGSEPECFGTILIPMSMNLNRTQTLPSDKPKSHKIAVAFGLSVGSVSLFILCLDYFFCSKGTISDIFRCESALHYNPSIFTNYLLWM
uniref:Leucine-rich repeat-containing N-terminal plant-type domain-containing protein n=1 Tax=Salix viminalis TaxID=40686 RepID=A0A6N2N9Z3_SALVM